MALRAFLGALPGDAMSKRSTIVDVGSMTASDCCAFFGEQSGVPKELIVSLLHFDGAMVTRD
jgi:hypothetical protein